MTGELIARKDLTHDQRRRMLKILSESFRHITAERFGRDLEEKNWAVLIRDDAQHIVGFSTLLLYPADFEGSRIAVVYSGDTIIERDAWGSFALPRTWIQSVWRLHQENCPELPLYWLLITSGYRTYRFLSVFWREFYPWHRGATPPRMQQLLRQLAQEKFGARFDPRAGVVRLGQPLRQELLGIAPAKMKDPGIAFFAQRNPGYVDGDELVCVTALTRDNLTTAGWRMVQAPQTATQRS